MSDKRVYFIRPVGQLGPIKIGCSKLPESRLDVMAIWSPVRLEFICSVPGTHADERNLHGMFARHRLHHEWFGASKELLALIEHCAASGALPELPRVVKFPAARSIGYRGRAAGKREPGQLPPEKMEFARLLRGQHESGVTIGDLARDHGKCVTTVRRYIIAAGGEIKWPKKAPAGVEDTSRAGTMRDRYLGGETLEQIGQSYGISRERVRQILRKTGVPSLGLRPEHTTPPHELTNEEIAAAKEYDAGVCPRELCRKYRITHSQLNSAVRRLGFTVKGTGHWLTRPDDAEITQRVCDLYKRGFTAPQIVARVEQLKFPETVYRYLKKGGVSPREPWKGNHRSNRGSRA